MKYNFLSILVSMLILCISISSRAYTQVPQELTFCHEDENAFPWVFSRNGKSVGLDLELIKLLEQKLGIPIKLEKLPWKRCLLEMKNGVIDGAFASSFKKNRLSLGKYPQKESGDLDTEKRIHISGYSLYYLKDSTLGWNGSKFTTPNSPRIFAQLGYSVNDKIKSLGAIPIEAKGIKEILERLLLEPADGAALQTQRADHILNTNASLADKIKKHPIPISKKPYYLMLSFKLTKSSPKFSQRIWTEISKIRNSKEFKKITQNFWKNHSNN